MKKYLFILLLTALLSCRKDIPTTKYDNNISIGCSCLEGASGSSNVAIGRNSMTDTLKGTYSGPFGTIKAKQ